MRQPSREEEQAQQEAMDLAAYEQEMRAAEAQAAQQQQSPYASSMFNQGTKQNLVEWELDFKPELQDIERLLRCDIIVRDSNGEHWAPNPNPARVFFNDVGVNDIIRNIIILVNKNKALANYNPEEIDKRVKQIKHEIRILIYNNYEEYGMDNPYKMNNYSMVVLAIGSIVEDVYRRAMYGETHKALSEQRLVTQSESMGAGMQNYNMPQQNKGGKKFSWINPTTW